MIEYTLPEILSKVAITNYSSELIGSVNTLLNTDSEIEYKEALKAASVVISGYQISGVNELDNAGYSDSNFEGLPIYQPFIFSATETIVNDLLLDSAIVEINRQKNIVVTNLQGRSSSVKEFINNGDYSITVTGLLCNNTASFPKTLFKELESFFSAESTLSIVHETLNSIGIYDIVITDYSFPNSPFTNIQPYSFNALSDTPIELTQE